MKEPFLQDFCYLLNRWGCNIDPFAGRIANMSEGKQENPLVRFLAVPFIIVWGLVFTVSAFWVSLRQTIDEWVGDVNFLYLGVGFLFFYTAVLVAEKNVMRSKFLNLLKEIQGFLIGKRYHQKIEAIQILINAVNKGNEKAAQTAADELKRITGQDFGPDHAAWSAWWKENKVKYEKGQSTFPDNEREK